MNQDTICAIATAQGGAIGSIRVSGPDAITITERIFTPVKVGKQLSDKKPYTLTFGHIHNEKEIVDEVLVSLFRAPHSYTGEDSTEITCHGSTYILQQVMQLLIKNGCRMLNPENIHKELFEWQDGSQPGRGCGRSDCFNLCCYPSFSHEPDAWRLQ